MECNSCGLPYRHWFDGKQMHYSGDQWYAAWNRGFCPWCWDTARCRNCKDPLHDHVDVESTYRCLFDSGIYERML